MVEKNAKGEKINFDFGDMFPSWNRIPDCRWYLHLFMIAVSDSLSTSGVHKSSVDHI